MCPWSSSTSSHLPQTPLAAAGRKASGGWNGRLWGNGAVRGCQSHRHTCGSPRPSPQAPSCLHSRSLQALGKQAARGSALPFRWPGVSPEEWLSCVLLTDWTFLELGSAASQWACPSLLPQWHPGLAVGHSPCFLEYLLKSGFCDPEPWRHQRRAPPSTPT